MSWSQIKLWAHSAGTPSRYSCLTLSLSTKEENLQTKLKFSKPLMSTMSKQLRTQTIENVIVECLTLTYVFPNTKHEINYQLLLEGLTWHSHTDRQVFLSTHDITFGNASFNAIVNILDLDLSGKVWSSPTLVKIMKNNFSKSGLSLPKQTYRTNNAQTRNISMGMTTMQHLFSTSFPLSGFFQALHYKEDMYCVSLHSPTTVCLLKMSKTFSFKTHQ